MNDPIELERVRITLRQLAHDARDTSETEFIKVRYKRQLVNLKWFIEDLIDDIGYFAGEEEWEKERTLRLLKRNKKIK